MDVSKTLKSLKRLKASKKRPLKRTKEISLLVNVKSKFSTLLASLLIITVTGCGGGSSNSVSKEPSVLGDIKDYDNWYKDANTDVISFDVSIPNPNSHNCVPWDDINAPSRPCTLDDINHDLDPNDNYKPILGIKFSTQDYSNNLENATFKIKGDYSRRAEQKSYSIKLNSKENLFYSQRKFSLAKSQSDASRIKNKLCFDIFREIPNITSLKTQFVQLYIDGNDYGLFTQVEAYRKEFLINRKWNEDDNLYNATGMFFDDWALENTAVNEKGEPLDEDKFEKILEIKNGKDHRALQEMLHAVNSNMDINTVIAKYFNRKNYLTWMAINLVISNKDTTYHNFYLYNPTNSKTFYFMPWDYDGAWATAKYLGKYEHGISVWWESLLAKKFLSIQKNRDDLYALADEIRNKYFTDTNMRKKIDSYENSVRPFQSRYPDNMNNSDSSWKHASDNLISLMPANIALYKNAIGDPMPFREYIEYNSSSNILNIHWTKSVDLENDPIVYDLKVSDNYDFNSTLLSIENIKDCNYSTIITLSQGTYYLKVISKETNNPTHWQEAFNRLEQPNKTIYGVESFHVQ